MTSGAALFDELTAGDATIRTRLAAAVADLTGAAGRTFVRLGFLSDPVFSLPEAAAVLNTDSDTATRMLEALLEASILRAPTMEVVAHDVVYEMQPVIHAYARELALDQAGLAAAGRQRDAS